MTATKQDLIDDLQRRLDDATDQMRTMVDDYQERNVDFTDADNAKYNRLRERAVRIRHQLDDARQLTGVSSERDGDVGFNIGRGRDPFAVDSVPMGATEQDLRARIETGLERDRHTPDDTKEAAVRTLDRVHGDRRELATRYLATGSETYRSAYAKLMAGRAHLWSDAERRVVERAQSLTNAGAANPIRQMARIVQTTTNEWNGVTSAGATASWDTEGEQVSDDSITLAQPNIPVHKMALFVPFSVEVGGDWAGIEQSLRMVMFDARDRLEATAHMTGTGSAQPTGIVTALAGGSSEVAADTAEAFTGPDVYNVQNQLPPRHRPNAQWAMNLGTSHAIRQFDTAGGGNFWTSLGGGTPERLLGWSANIASEMDDASSINPAATANNYVLIAGDWSNFVIVDRVGMTIELVPHLFGTANNRPTGQRGLYGFLRTGSDSINDDAFRMLNVATTA